LKTVLVGFGRIANSIRHDKKISRYFKYASHAQVLRDHPDFDWIGVVDPDKEAREEAEKWRVEYVGEDVIDAEFAVLAIPPQYRMAVIDEMPSLKKVLVEKPLGDSGARFLQECEKRKIIPYVNYWRRGDKTYQKLANGELHKRIGTVQAAFATYGNGLYNNGSHLVDFLQMMFGNVLRVGTVGDVETIESLGCSGPMDDVSASFILGFTGFDVMVQPLDYNHYREFSLDIWGTKGRLAFYQESLGIYYYPRAAHRAMTNQKEISSDRFEVIPQTVADAFYNIYTGISKGTLPIATIETQEILEEISE